ncbi:MAG: hypothetical protein J0L85_08560 [Zoogloea sp.]|nr:hypothetical protein [Zoogloea sp.]MCA0187338.1 hypothetical protein [Pseudomonadota bacterium]
MIDEIAEFAMAASLDVATKKAAKRHAWVRVVSIVVGLLFVALIVGLVYLSFKYA